MASSIDCLPAKVLAMLREMVDNPRITQLTAVDKINAVLAELRQAGDPEALDPACPEAVSKSSVSRAVQKWTKVGERLRRSREIGQMLIEKVGAVPGGEMGLAINEMLRSLSFDVSETLLDADLANPETLAATISHLKSLSLASQRLEQGATINVKRASEIRKQALADAAEAVGKAAQKLGITQESIDEIHSTVLGI